MKTYEETKLTWDEREDPHVDQELFQRENKQPEFLVSILKEGH